MLDGSAYKAHVREQSEVGARLFPLFHTIGEMSFDTDLVVDYHDTDWNGQDEDATLSWAVDCTLEGRTVEKIMISQLFDSVGTEPLS